MCSNSTWLSTGWPLVRTCFNYSGFSIEWNHDRLGRGALSRAVPTNPRRLVGTLRFPYEVPSNLNAHGSTFMPALDPDPSEPAKVLSLSVDCRIKRAMTAVEKATI